MCLYCGNGFSNNNSFIELPCQCCICDKNDCFEEYIKINKKTKNKNKKKENGQEGSFYSPMKNCPCGAKINLNYIISMINIIDEKKLNKHYKEEFQELILIHWKWRCMICGQNFNNETKFYRIFFNDDELNSLDYNYALEIDFRSYCQFYFSLLRQTHLIIFTFCVKNDYNIFLLKLALFLLSFSLFLFMNALFFDDDSMHRIYEDKGKYDIINRNKH